MKTHRTLVCLALVGIAALAPSVFSAEKVIPSQWAAVPVRIDGANQEWQDAAIIVEKGSKAEYALRNDDKYLYILFVFKALGGSGDFWRKKETLMIAARYYGDASMLAQARISRPQTDSTTDYTNEFGTLTHDYADGETPGLPPTVPAP